MLQICQHCWCATLDSNLFLEVLKTVMTSTSAKKMCENMGKKYRDKLGTFAGMTKFTVIFSSQRHGLQVGDSKFLLVAFEMLQISQVCLPRFSPETVLNQVYWFAAKLISHGEIYITW